MPKRVNYRDCECCFFCKYAEKDCTNSCYCTYFDNSKGVIKKLKENDDREKIHNWAVNHRVEELSVCNAFERENK